MILIDFQLDVDLMSILIPYLRAPFTASFPRADIHQLILLDLLHQLVKGTFKDHLVNWVFEYLDLTYLKREADERKADIDRRACTIKMVKTIRDFLEFCYLACRDVIDEDTLAAMDVALTSFHQHREIFRTTGVRPEGFSLPRQHSMVHYQFLIQQFGAPNGLCSSITESKHIKAVKHPWRFDVESAGMLKMAPKSVKRLHSNLPLPPPPSEDQDDEEGPSDEPYSQGDVKLSKRAGEGCDVPLGSCPELANNQRVYLHHSARATFFTPSDMSGLGGMRHEHIRSVRSWRGGPARYNCRGGFKGLLVGRVFMFFHFTHQSQSYECALIQWYSTVGVAPCDQTGLWMVEPNFNREGQPNLKVVHIDCLYCGAHLIGVTGDSCLPTKNFSSTDSLDAYSSFYVNKYVDYHAHEIAF
ncbi:hypothetical protein BT96DRAFT_959979 [Gymnopus androsaceus JB14]|uniref:Uncharacterized protein n=1 Tax=Gymnopus androsaceus JB14 TaxID=1447944 RepID=A0A6A4GV62_9AGAR|nr:hypothetical protein BT96DRAFT_959979 [Gymnopus androsaceus JB14]